MIASLIGILVSASFASTVPKVSLGFWNSQDRQYDNNCYNYSTNRATNSFAQPGEASGKIYEDITCKDVVKAAKADLGLVKTKYFGFSGKEDDSLIALVVAPGWDYHWYRRDDSGMWSHKPGGTPATTSDNANNEISDPEKADRGPYSEFCGYFKVTNLPTEDHEQNAGQVRIGNMDSLPARPSYSTIETSRYSGRRNPVYSLQLALNNPEISAKLVSVKAQVQSSMPVVHPIRRPYKLGEEVYIIRDVEGLLFAPGTVAEIRGSQVVLMGALPFSGRQVFELNQPMKFDNLK